MKERKFFVELSSGSKFAISERDYNNIHDRIVSGRTNGWYVQRDHDFTEGDRYGWKISFKDIATIYATGPERGDKVIRKPEAIDVDKRKPKEPGKLPEKPKKCGHDWNKPDDYDYVTTIHDGRNRYWKMCKECGNKSTLIKKREVENAMEAIDKTIDDVPLVEG
jgi:hypothetical protein